MFNKRKAFEDDPSGFALGKVGDARLHNMQKLMRPRPEVPGVVVRDSAFWETVFSEPTAEDLHADYVVEMSDQGVSPRMTNTLHALGLVSLDAEPARMAAAVHDVEAKLGMAASVASGIGLILTRLR